MTSALGDWHNPMQRPRRFHCALRIILAALFFAVASGAYSAQSSNPAANAASNQGSNPTVVQASPSARQVPQFPQAWDEAVRSLADEIAAAATPAHILVAEVKNISSLSAPDAESVRQMLEADLAEQHFLWETTKTPPASPASPETTAQLILTFSEGVQGYVWVAQIQPGDSEKTVMVFAPKREFASADKAMEPLVLNRKAVWQQAAPILDFVLLSPASSGGSSTLVIIQPDRLAFYKVLGGHSQPLAAIPILHPGYWPRDLRGRINLADKTVRLPGVECSGDFENPDSFHCSTEAQSKSTPVLDQKQPATMEGLEGGEVVRLPLKCGSDSVALATGTDDWTQPDEIQAYKIADGQAMESGEPMDFAGPILEMRAEEDGTSVRVISRNLQTELYEASLVFVSCGD